MTSMTRRQVLGSVLAGTGLVAMHPYRLSAGENQVHTLNVGDFKVSVISDGFLDVPAQGLAVNVPNDELEKFLKSNGLPVDRRISPLNVTLVQTAKENILIDTGGGMNFLADAGKLSENFEAAGLDPQSINKVILTHAHPDHVWGIIDDFEEAERFPNAEYFIGAKEWDFWMDKDVLSKLPERLHGFAVGAQNNMKPIAEKITRVLGETDVVSGVSMVETSGHTPGHMSVMLESEKSQLLVLGDAATHAHVSFAHPSWALSNDQDGDLAAATRKTLLDGLATDGIPVIGYHLPWPGIGRVERSGNAYRYIAG